MADDKYTYAPDPTIPQPHQRRFNTTPKNIPPGTPVLPRGAGGYLPTTNPSAPRGYPGYPPVQQPVNPWQGLQGATPEDLGFAPAPPPPPPPAGPVFTGPRQPPPTQVDYEDLGGGAWMDGRTGAVDQVLPKPALPQPKPKVKTKGGKPSKEDLLRNRERMQAKAKPAAEPVAVPRMGRFSAPQQEMAQAQSAFDFATGGPQQDFTQRMQQYDDDYRQTQDNVLAALLRQYGM